MDDAYSTLPPEILALKDKLSDRDVLWLVYGALFAIGNQMTRQNTLLRLAVTALAVLAAGQLGAQFLV